MGEQRGCIVGYSDLFVFLKVLPTTSYHTVTTRCHKETNTEGNKIPTGTHPYTKNRLSDALTQLSGSKLKSIQPTEVPSYTITVKSK
jgi:hypothetical protein